MLLWDSPDAPARAGIIVQHGFARSPQKMAGIAGLLGDRGFLAVRPSIPSFRIRRSLHDATWLDAFGDRIVAVLHERAPGVPVFGIGHSAGAAVVAGWSGLLDAIVLLDPVDRHSRIDRCAADSQRPPMRVITADPSACNRHGRATRMLADRGCVEADRTWVRIEGTSHADPERVPVSLHARDVPASDPLARWACGPGGTPDAVCRWGRAIVEDVEELLAARSD